MTDLSCPNCGYECPAVLNVMKIAACVACGTTLYLDGEHMAGAGVQGVMHDAPLLFGIGDSVDLSGEQFNIIGHARYSYGRGFWDEFCALDDNELPVWISVDEGDIVEQYRIDAEHSPKFRPPFKPGETLEFLDKVYKVTETETATCVALRGQFDEVLHVGESYEFVNASARGSKMLSGEFFDGQAMWFSGRWHDPFEVKVTRAA